MERLSEAAPSGKYAALPAHIILGWKSLLVITPGNTKGGSINVQLTSCLTGLESAVQKLTILVLFAKQMNPNQSNKRSMVQ